MDKLQNYEIDFDKVKSLDDVKRILQAMNLNQRKHEIIGLLVC